jgi:hypothetical protein
MSFARKAEAAHTIIFAAGDFQLCAYRASWDRSFLLRKPITLAQATLVAQRFGVSIEDIMRDREVVSE